MKPYFFFFLILFCQTTLGQSNERFSSQRKQLYNAGIKHSVHYFDSLVQNLTQQRIQEKLTEPNFIDSYNELEQRYRNQQQIVAKIAEKWTGLQAKKPSKLIKNALALISRGQVNAALGALQSKKNSLIELEEEFRLDLFLFCGQKEKYSDALPVTVKDSLDKIWSLRSEPFTKGDTFLFVQNKIFIAQKYYEEKDVASAIGTLLEAQQWNNYLNTQDLKQRKASAHIAFTLGQWQLLKTDIDNAFRNAKLSVDIYQTLMNENTQSEFAAALHNLALVYKTAGANREADTIFHRAISVYEELVQLYPERYQPLLVQVWDDYAQVQRYFDQYDAFEKNLRKLIEWRQQLSISNYPFYQLDLGKTLNVLGQKLMNTDVKIFLAQEQWAKSKEVLEPLQKRLLMLAGNEYCSVLYKLGGAKIALKKRTESLPYFLQSLDTRTQLYKLAPSQNQRDYVDVLTQNATLNALEQKKEVSIMQLDMAIKVVEELGDKKYADEIRKFKKDVQTH